MSTQQAAQKPTGLQWIALSLLVVSVAINYADRGNLGVAARSIQNELHFDANKLGMLSTGFFWTYSIFQLVAGKVIDRWNVNWAYAVGFLVWSAATGITGLVNSFYLIFLFRLLLGAGEAVAYPSYSKIIATSFPEQLRGTANALIDAGSKVGPAIGVMLGALVMNRFTWRGMFILIGGASLIWLIPWCIVAAKIPTKKLEKASAWAPTYKELAYRRRFWGTAIGLFGGNYVWYFFLTWLPYYFETERHFPKDKLALVGSLPFWAVAVASMLFGLIADAMIRRGRDAGRVRQTFVATGLFCCCAFMFPAVIVKDPGDVDHPAHARRRVHGRVLFEPLGTQPATGRSFWSGQVDRASELHRELLGCGRRLGYGEDPVRDAFLFPGICCRLHNYPYGRIELLAHHRKAGRSSLASRRVAIRVRRNAGRCTSTAGL